MSVTAVVGPMARRVTDLRATFAGRAHLARPVVDPASHGTAKQVQEGGQRLVDAGYTVDEAEPPSIDVVAKTLLRLCG